MTRFGGNQSEGGKPPLETIPENAFARQSVYYTFSIASLAGQPERFLTLSQAAV